MSQLVDDATINKNADRVLERVSPSQVEAFEMCERRWYNDIIRGLREPMVEGSAADRGVKIAAEVEHYGKTGKVRPDALFKPMVEAVLPFLSEPSKTVSVEEWVELETEPGLPNVRGRYDWFDCAQKQWEAGHPRAPLLPDVKSRSDFRYAKTPAELADDTQLNVYGTALARRDGYGHITLRHAYTRTSGKPKGMAVSVTVSRDELEARFKRTIEAVRRMTHWAKERPRTADPLPPNSAACDKFRPHGCPHRALCGFTGSPFNTNRSNKMPETNGAPPSDLMKRLQARTAQLTGAAPAQAPAPTSGVAERYTKPAAVAGALSTESARPAFTEEQVLEALVQIKEGHLKLDGTGQAFVRDGADKGYLLRRLTPAQTEAFRRSDEQHTKVEEQILSEEAKGPAVVAADAPPRTDQPSDAVEPAAEAKPARKPRAKKADAAQTELPSAQASETDSIDDLREELRVARYNEAQMKKYADEAYAALKKQGNAEVGTITGGPIVYINCVPTKGDHRNTGVHFEEWLAPICEELCKEKGVVDYRLIQYTAKGDLAAKVRKYITLCPPVVLVSKFSPSADVFLESVIPYAAQIIQGV